MAKRENIQASRVDIGAELQSLAAKLSGLAKKVEGIAELAKLDVGGGKDPKHETGSIFSILHVPTQVNKVTPRGINSAFRSHKAKYGRLPADIIMSPEHFAKLRCFSAKEAALVGFEIDTRWLPSTKTIRAGMFGSIHGVKVTVCKGHPKFELL